MAKNRALSVALLGLTLTGCGDSPALSGTKPVQHPTIATHVREPELAESSPPMAESAHTDAQRTAVVPVEPTFPGLAATPGGPAPRIADCEIELARTWCLGTCPIYTVRVRGDGSVSYSGEKYVLRAERVEAKIDPALLERLLREMETADFLRHHHKCASMIRDTPGTKLTLRVGGTSQTVVDRFRGRDCGFREPSADPDWHATIDRIGKLVDEIVGSEQWTGTLEERRAAFKRDR